MYQLKKDNRINDLIAITKSDSGISGPELAKAHMELGFCLGETFEHLKPEDTTIVAILRGGLFFCGRNVFPAGMQVPNV